MLLLAAWLGTMFGLIYLAGVPIWLAFIGNIAGAAVIRNYARTLHSVKGERGQGHSELAEVQRRIEADVDEEASVSRLDTTVRIGAHVLLGTVAVCFALLLVVTMLAFLVAWLAN